MKPLRVRDLAPTNVPVDEADGTPLRALAVAAALGLAEQPSASPVPCEEAPSDRVDLSPVLDVTPLDQALVDIFTKAGKPYIPGGSGLQGWSAIKTLQRCAYEYWVSYVVGPEHVKTRQGRKEALEIGILYHLLRSMEELIILKREAEVIDPDELRDRLLEAKCSGEVVMEAYRLDHHYRITYENDYLEPLGTEHRVALPGDLASARYDAIVDVQPNDLVVPGTYILERKTTSRFDAGTTEGWANDGGILGQQMIWKANRLDRKYGKLQGTIVCLVSKTKVPVFRRIIVPVQKRLLAQHAGDLTFWRAYRAMCEATGNWPRSRAACVSRYGLCDYFYHCAGG